MVAYSAALESERGAFETVATSEAFAAFLESKYRTTGELSRRWGTQLSFADVEAGTVTADLSDRAKADVEAFSERLVCEFYETVCGACAAVDPNHLNLGTNFHGFPIERWLITCLEYFDIVSSYCYQPQPEIEGFRKVDYARISEEFHKPILLSEFQFGSLDSGLPASGLVAADDQEDRAQQYRRFVEAAAAKPWCVGTHYFRLYDQCAVGDHTGENYNTGFFDVCDRPYEELASAAREAHGRVYDIRTRRD